MLPEPISNRFYLSLYSNAERTFLDSSPVDGGDMDFAGEIDSILESRSGSEDGLDPGETAKLLHLVQRHPDPHLRDQVIAAAREVRRRAFGQRVATMVPIEVSSFCASTCRFCGWRADNKDMIRLAITETAIREQARALAKKGFSHFEIAGGDDLKFLRENLLSLVSGLKEETRAINPEARVSLCLVPMHQSHYEELKSAGLDCVLTWQETYKEDLYNHHIPAGPKAWGVDQDLRLNKKTEASVGFLHRLRSQELAVRAGLQAGLGTMIGLAEITEADILSVIGHGQALIKRYDETIEPLIIGMPAWNPILTRETDNRSAESPGFDTEGNFELISAIYLLAFPNRRAWVFANGRVHPTIQTDCIATASCFTSTLVQIAPGAYLELADGAAPRSLFDRVRGLEDDELTRDNLLSGEQFMHYFDSHENFIANFEARDLEIVSDRSLLLHDHPAGLGSSLGAVPAYRRDDRALGAPLAAP